MAPTISVDPTTSPRVITVLAPDTEITMQELVDLTRSWETSVHNLEWPHLLNASGKEVLRGTKRVGITAELQDAQLAFEARPGPTFARCSVVDGNLVAVDSAGNAILAIAVTAYTQVVVELSSSPTIVGGDPATVAAAVWDEPASGHAAAGTFGARLDAKVSSGLLDSLLAGHFTPDSVGEALALVRGLVQQNFVLDNTSYNGSGLLTAGRIRIFPNAASAGSATGGGSGQGELASFLIDVQATGMQTALYRVVRQ